MKFISFAQGKKTYAVVAVGVALGVAEHFGWQPPGWANWVLGFLGLGTLRMAVTAQSAKSAADVAVLMQTIFEAITVKDINADLTGATVKVIPVEVHELPPVK